MVLTREAGRNEQLRAWVGEGVDVAEVALTETHFVDDATLEASLDAHRRQPWRSLVITSARAARAATLASERCDPDVELFSVGAATTAALANAGLATPVAQSSAGALALAAQVRHSPVLVLGAAQLRRDLADALVARGLGVHVVACYETRGVELDAAQCATLADGDVVVVGAPSAWRVARDVVGPHTWVVVPGATTAAVVRVTHERVLEGWGPSLGGRLAALEREAD